MTIRFFKGEHRWLSNFWPCSVQLDGEEYPSVEHAYQAAKTLDPHERLRIRHAPKPGLAKKLGRKLNVRDDWEQVKLQTMEYLLRQKFRKGTDLASKLQSTANQELVENNNWGDKFWGVCQDEGENHLGELLMQIRKELG